MAEQAFCKRKVEGSIPSVSFSWGFFHSFHPADSSTRCKSNMTGVLFPVRCGFSSPVLRGILAQQAEQVHRKHQVVGSTPIGTFHCGSGSVVRASAFQAEDEGSIPFYRLTPVRCVILHCVTGDIR